MIISVVLECPRNKLSNKPTMSQEEARRDILVLAKAGLSCEEIASHVGVHVKTVQRTCSKGTASRKRYKTRKKTALSANAKRIITKTVKNVPAGLGVRKVAKMLAKRGIRASASSVQRFVVKQKWGKSHKAKSTPLLSEKNISDRLLFAKQLQKLHHIHNDKHWHKVREVVLFTDESRVELHGRPNKQNVRIRSADPDAAKFVGTVKHDPVCVQVFGGITWRGMTKLHILEAGQRINSDFYCKQMLPKYKADIQQLYGVDAGKVLLQEDGAPAHTSEASSGWVSRNWPGQVFVPHPTKKYASFLWPGNSPDLNPIENIWTELQDSVYKLPRPQNKSQLVERLQQTWKLLEQEGRHIQLIDSFPRRVQKMVELNGKHCGY